MRERFLLTDNGDGTYRLVSLGTKHNLVCYIKHEELQTLMDSKETIIEKNYPGSSNPYGQGVNKMAYDMLTFKDKDELFTWLESMLDLDKEINVMVRIEKTTGMTIQQISQNKEESEDGP